MSRLLAWLTSILLLLLVLEGLVRLFTSAPATEYDPRLGWAYKPRHHATRSTDGQSWDFRTSSARLRAPEGCGLGPKRPGEARVLLLGDSFTAGWGLESDQTFAAQLEKFCWDSGRDVTVIPAGTEGYYTDQECLWLEASVARYQPDIVVVCPYANDVAGNAQDRYLGFRKPRFEVTAGRPIAADPPAVPDDRPFLLRVSRLYSTLNGLALAFGSRLSVPLESGGGRLQLDDFPFLRRAPRELEEGWRATDAIAARLVDTAKAAGAKPFAAPIPNRFEIHAEDAALFERQSGSAPGSFDFAQVTGRLAESFARAGAAILEARSPLAAAAASGERLYFHQDWHFNAAGARLYAKSLFAGLAEAGVLPAAGAPKAGPTPLALEAPHHASPGIPAWAYVVGVLWVVLSLGYRLSYPEESSGMAFLQVGLLLAFVVGVFAGLAFVTSQVPPIVKFLLFAAIVVGIGSYAIYKMRARFSTIRELFGALVDRGHWYLVPMLVVMLTISILLVVAQNPIVAPFIYTLF